MVLAAAPMPIIVAYPYRLVLRVFTPVAPGLAHRIPVQNVFHSNHGDLAKKVSTGQEPITAVL
jgi:hypothetical protein